MKSTGIVRRLDDLGHLVIPKEIRKIYKLKEGDSIEFFVSDENEIIIKKYQHLQDDYQHIIQMIETFQELFKTVLLFYGDDHIIVSHSQYQNTVLTSEAIEKVKTYHFSTINSIRIFENNSTKTVFVFPLVLDSHWVGSFLLIEEHPNDTMRSVINSYCHLLARQM